MVDDVAEKTRNIIDAARSRRTSDAEPGSATDSDRRPASDPATLLAPTADEPSDEPEFVPAAIASVVAPGRRALSLLLLLVIGIAAGIVVGTGVLAAITWISDAALTSFA